MLVKWLSSTLKIILYYLYLSKTGNNNIPFNFFQEKYHKIEVMFSLHFVHFLAIDLFLGVLAHHCTDN